MQKQPITRLDAEAAKDQNIIEMGWGFSRMARVFVEQAQAKILKRLGVFFAELNGVKTQSEYDDLHSGFCDWMIQNIAASPRRGCDSTAPIRKSSFGEAAKTLDVVAKVYIYYCARPSAEAAERLVPMLHAALDTKMMHNLSHKSPPSLYGVDRTEYQRLQALVTDAIADSGIYPVQYDDVMWRHLQRRKTRTTELDTLGRML